jgi:Flp pilus assembly protein TadG
MRRSFLRDENGAALVEISLIFPMMLVLTFGLVEFGHALWQYHVAEKATAIAVRYAATRGPLAPQLIDGGHDCFVANPADVAAGTACSDPAIPAAAAITCTSGSGACDAAVWSAVVAEMQAIAPFIAEENVRVDLSQSKLGFVGRGAAVPVITVSTTGLTYDFVTLGDLLGLQPIGMPSFASSLTAEDQQEGPGT